MVFTQKARRLLAHLHLQTQPQIRDTLFPFPSSSGSACAPPFWLPNPYLRPSSFSSSLPAFSGSYLLDCLFAAASSPQYLVALSLSVPCLQLCLPPTVRPAISTCCNPSRLVPLLAESIFTSTARGTSLTSSYLVVSLTALVPHLPNLCE
jgi:hypothetical protein